MFRGTPIYTNTVDDLRKGVRRIVHQGGAWSGKTVNILGAYATLASEEEPTDTDSCITTITSQSMPHLKGGALRDFESFVYPHFKNAIKSYHRTDHVFTFKSGSRIEFKVFENEMTARGNKRKRLFVNEANSFPWMIYYQLDSRSDQTVIDYNPSVRFWAHENVKGQDGTKFYRSWHEHNPFLSKSRHAEIEGQKDPELWKVYARGITGNVMGVIFPDWEIIDEQDFPEGEQFVWSIDFGYTIDPTAIIKQCRIGNTLYVKELAYETGLSDYSIRNILIAEGFDCDEDILHCEHDPDMIRELRNVGITNAMFARKGQGSVNAGIELLKKYRVKYTNKSQNLHRERQRYIWTVDKKTGKTINVPVDNNNHTFDAIRYGAYSTYLQAA